MNFVNILLMALVAVADGSPTTLIYGGREAYPGEFPWLVSIQATNNGGLTYSHICGGTIVSSTSVITGAHCVLRPAITMRIVAGAHVITQNEDSQQIANVSRSTLHREYDSVLYRNDIALLEVYPPLKLTDRVMAVQLPPDNIESSGMCQIAGWGTTEWSNGDIVDVLRTADVPIVPKPLCFATYPDNFQNNTQLCAGYRQGSVDVCTGDTGGAIICHDMGYNKYFAGIASYGYYCARPGFPGVYTQISKFLEFVLNPEWTN